MKHKSQALTIFSQFLIDIKTQFQTNLQSIQSDHGKEFLSTDFQTFIRTKGIIYLKSCVYTPQQNGIVERKHRHILEVARCLRNQSNIPIKFWSDCVNTAVYIINRIPSPILKGKTPYHMIYQKEPVYTHLRIFGCLCYFLNNKRSNKFDNKSTKGIFVGYPHA